MECSACKGQLKRDFYLQCNGCNEKFDYDCLGIKTEQFSSLTREYKKNWLCPVCTTGSRRKKIRDDTPVKGSPAASSKIELMNMSFDQDNQELGVMPLNNESTQGKGALMQQVTLDSISALLDQKLSSSFSSCMANLKDTLTKEIRDQISSEIKGVVSSIKEEFITTNNNLRKAQSNIKAEVGKLDKKLTNLSLNFKTDLSTLQTPSSGLKAEFNETLERLSRENNSKLQNIQTHVEREISDLKASIQFTSQQFDDFKACSSSATSHSKTIDLLNEELSTTKNKLQEIQSELEDQHQRDRFLNIEIVGLPERKSENLAKLAIDISEHINAPITLQDIDHIHRVQPRQKIDGRPRVVVCKLRSRLIKSSLLAGFRKVRGLNTEDIGIDGPAVKIYIREHLTSKNKELYREARRVCDQRGFKYCWIKNCKILVRKNDNCPFFQVNTLEDLKKIK